MASAFASAGQREVSSAHLYAARTWAPAVALALDDLQYLRMDGDGDGLTDYAAVDIHLTKIVDFAAHRNGDVVEVQRFDAEGPADYDEFGADEFGESFPGWADLIGVNFPDGIPDDVALNQVVAVVNEVLFPH
jgi:hypothetical protein